MDLVDFLPPTAPSLVFARETFTPYKGRFRVTWYKWRPTQQNKQGLQTAVVHKCFGMT